MAYLSPSRGLWERWKDGILSFTILTTKGWVARPEDLDAKIQLFPDLP
jgi:hypothetical protein